MSHIHIYQDLGRFHLHASGRTSLACKWKLPKCIVIWYV